MEKKIANLLKDHAETLFGQAIPDENIQIQNTRKEFEGDITLVLFPFIKMMRVAPQVAGEKIGTFLTEQVAEIRSYNVVSGFLNLSIAADSYLKDFQEILENTDFGFEKPNSKPAIMVEYSSPNTNKPLHLGHLRNIFLGYSVSEILKANGHEVIKTQIINDRGIHICKSMLAWDRFSPVNEKGERETPSNTGLKGDKLVGKYYVEFDKNFNREAKQIIADWEQGVFEDYPEHVTEEFTKLNSAKSGKDEKAIKAIDAKIKDLAKNETQLLKDAKEMLIRWEARDPQTYLLWSTMNGWVYEGFEKTYRSMGVDFDKLYYESDTFLLGKDIVLEGLKNGVFFKKEDGSVWIDLSDEGLDEKLVLRSDGTSVYMTQDLGTAVDRFKDFPQLSGMVYTVGNEQDYHFKVLFLILKKMGYQWAENCFHLSYGMVDLPSGKMKSREGTVVDADDLIAEVIEKAKAMTEERGHLDGMTAEEVEKLYKMIGLGGLKYYLLKVDPRKRMLFNPDESIELNGNTGPFIQYCYARIQSLLAKAGELGVIEGAQMNEQEIELIKLMRAFPQTISEAAQNYSPALLANYLFELVKAYNHYYQLVHILTETDEPTKNFRLAMSQKIGEIIGKGMKLLGIEVPARM